MSNFLDGKKTYIVALAMIIYGATGLFLNHLSQDEALRFIMEGFAFIFLRRGVAKTQY